MERPGEQPDGGDERSQSMDLPRFQEVNCQLFGLGKHTFLYGHEEIYLSEPDDA